MSETTTIEMEAPPEAEAPEPTPQQRVRLARDDAMERIAARRAEALERELGQAERMDSARHPDAGTTRPGDALDAVPGRPVVEGNPAESAALDRDSNRESGHLRRPEPAGAAPPQPQQAGLREVEIDGHKFTVTEEQFQELARAGVRAYVAPTQQPPAFVPPQAQVAHQQHGAPTLTQAQYAAQQQALMQQRAMLAQQQAQQVPALTQQQLEQYAERLQYGGKDAIAETLAEYGNHIAQLARQGAVTHQQLAQYVALAQQQEAARRAQAQLQADLTVIEKEYPQIGASADLGMFAAVKLGELRQELGPRAAQIPAIDQYREACNRVMAVIRPAGQQAPRQPSQAAGPAPVRAARSEAVFERKREAPRQLSGIDMRAPPPAPDRPRTGAEIVRQMAKARGQQVE